MSSFYCTAGRGTEKFAHAECKKLFKTSEVSEIDGKVFFTCDQPITVEQINGLKTVERIFVRINYLSASEIDRKDKNLFMKSLCDKVLNKEEISAAFNTYRQLFSTCKHECEEPMSKKVKYEHSGDTHSNIPAVPTFRISCKISGRFKGCVHPQHLSQKLGAKLVKFMGWKVDLKHPQVEVCVHINDEHVIAGIPTSKIPVSKRKYIAKPGLRSTISWIMCHLADIQSGDVVLDPMCGKATILVEGALKVKTAVFIGCDNNINQLQCALENRKSASLEHNLHFLHCSSLGLPLRSNSIDRVVCDAPFGQKFTTDIKLEDFYTKLLKEVLRVLKSHGKAVVMTSSDLRPSVIKQLKSLDNHDGASTVSTTHSASSLKETASLESPDIVCQKDSNNSAIPPETGNVNYNDSKNSSDKQNDNEPHRLTSEENNSTFIDNQSKILLDSHRHDPNKKTDISACRPTSVNVCVTSTSTRQECSSDDDNYNQNETSIVTKPGDSISTSAGNVCVTSMSTEQEIGRVCSNSDDNCNQNETSILTKPGDLISTYNSSPGNVCDASISTGQGISRVCSSDDDHYTRKETSSVTKTCAGHLVLLEDYYVKLGETSAYIIVMQKL